MKRPLLILFALHIGSVSLFSQSAAELLNINSEHNFSELSIDKTPLFDQHEIKARSIKSCYITRSMHGDNRHTAKADTRYKFYFDKKGVIEREIRFSRWSWTRNDSIEGSRSEEKYYNRIDSTIEKENGQTTITKYYVWHYDPAMAEEDTGYIKKFVYDGRGYLVHFIMNGTTDYFRFTFCGTGITKDIKYRYDENGRLIFYQDVYSREYAIFKHYKNHIDIRVYDSVSNKLSRKSTAFITNNDKLISERHGGYIKTMTRLHKGSNLFSMFSEKQGKKDRAPNTFFLIYEYYNEPRQKSDAVYTMKGETANR